jgi:hypothetical protein
MSKFERVKHFELIELLKWIEEWKGFSDKSPRWVTKGKGDC